MRRATWTLAAHEALRHVRFVDRRTLAAAAILGLGLALAAPLMGQHAPEPDRDLFHVEVEPGSPYLAVVLSDASYHVATGRGALFLEGRADLLILDDVVNYDPDSERSRAALRDLGFTTRDWLDQVLEKEADANAAFPVRVHLVFEPRTGTAAPSPAAPQTDTPTETTVAPGDPPRIVPTLDPGSASIRPNQVQPPFPVQSLLLTFAYLIPLNLIGQLYAGAIYAERIRQRGVLLLSAPLAPAQVLWGKSLPYVGVALAAGLAATLLIGSNLAGLVAILPVFAFLLAASLLLGILARSPRELTFLLVALTVLVSTFLFLPAIFTRIHPVAYLSPVTVVIDTLEGDATPLPSFLYATLPLTAAATVLAALAVVLYREEDLFAPARVLSKVATGLHRLAPTRASLVAASALAVPFAIGLELFVLIFAVTLELRTAFVLFLLGGALVEEALKGLLIWSHLHRSTGPPTRAWVLGLLVGGGFFLGEKIALVFSLVGFDLLPLGPEVLATYGVSSAPLLLLAPLALHSATATVTAYAARRGKTAAALGLFAATLIHAGYNTTILAAAVLGGGEP